MNILLFLTEADEEMKHLQCRATFDYFLDSDP